MILQSNMGVTCNFKKLGKVGYILLVLHLNFDKRCDTPLGTQKTIENWCEGKLRIWSYSHSWTDENMGRNHTFRCGKKMFHPFLQDHITVPGPWPLKWGPFELGSFCCQDPRIMVIMGIWWGYSRVCIYETIYIYIYGDIIVMYI